VALEELRAWRHTQFAALILGVWWIGNGVAVFLVAEPGVATLDANGTVSVLGLSIAVNGWHGLFHLLSGLVGIAVCRSPAASRAYALIVGALYLTAAAYSVFNGATVFGLIHVDELGSLDHALEGALLISLWLSTLEGTGREA
jgi:hypothetical protein